MITSEAATALGSPTTMSDQSSCPICAAPNPIPWLTAPDRFNGRQKQYHLLRCPACSLVWLDAAPAKAEMCNHYGSDYDRTIAEASQAPDHWHPRREEIFRIKSGGDVLDLGCGSGGFLDSLKGPAWRLSGIEMSEGAASVARSRCDAAVFVGDILDAPFPPESFDVITGFNVFEHLYEPKEVLARVAEWLRPGGIFYTMMPNIDSAGARIFRSYWYALELPRHLFHFSPTTLRMLARSAGLQEVFITAHRELYFESSARYVVDDLLKRIGISRKPLARTTSPRLPMKVLRKLFRMSILPLFTAAASFMGDGETVTAVFIKDSAPHETSD